MIAAAWRRPSRRGLCLALVLCGGLPGIAAPQPLEQRLPLSERRLLQQDALFTIQFLQSYHYASRPFHELAAPEFLDSYLSRLDPDRLILTAADVAFVHRRFDRNLKTVYLFAGDLHPAFEIHDLFLSRALARCDWIAARLQPGFVSEGTGELQFSRSDSAWPADSTAADTLWTQWLQMQTAGEIIDGRSADQATALVRERYARFRAQLAGTDPLAVREQFLSCLLEFFDPHSGYFSRANADEFNVAMAGAVAGIGLDLNAVDGRFFVQAVAPGGPCDLQGDIRPGDELLALSEDGQPPKPLAGLRLREVVALARGKPDSRVTLSLKNPAAPDTPRTVVITRTRVDLSARHACAYLVQVPTDAGTRPIGVVDLPAFYGSAPEEGVEVSMAADVRSLLEQLSAAGARGLVVDLRDNGGGVLSEATRLGGLFLAGGPLLHVQGNDAPVETLRDEDAGCAYNGPLVILTSRQSASASEAFAGAMRCYDRALVLGAETTFGKGTVQAYIDISSLPNVATDLRRVGGVARITRQLYYLPDGRSPQLAGVKSDLVLPGYRHPEMKTEDSLPHALPATSIPQPEPLPALPPEIARLTPALRQELQSRSEKRQTALPEFELRRRSTECYNDWWGGTTIPLSIGQRREQQAARDETRSRLRKESHQLGTQSAFAYRRFDLPATLAAREAHQRVLRTRRTGAGGPCIDCYDSGIYYYCTPADGSIRDIPLAALDLEECRTAAATLAAAWTEASGVAMPVDNVRAVLADLEEQREHPGTTRPVEELFRSQFPDAIDGPALARGLSAFFRAAVELSPRLTHDLGELDVPLRESLRLAADWADIAPATPPAQQAPAPAASAPPSAPPSSVPQAQP